MESNCFLFLFTKKNSNVPKLKSHLLIFNGLNLLVRLSIFNVFSIVICISCSTLSWRKSLSLSYTSLFIWSIDLLSVMKELKENIAADAMNYFSTFAFFQYFLLLPKSTFLHVAWKWNFMMDEIIFCIFTQHWRDCYWVSFISKNLFRYSTYLFSHWEHIINNQ